MRIRPGAASRFVLIAALAFAARSLPAAGDDAPPRKKVAILVFDGVQTIDFAAPLGVLSGPFEVFTVGPTREPVRTAQGTRVVPDFSIADAPQAVVLIVPGGGAHRAESKTMFEMAERRPD